MDVEVNTGEAEIEDVGVHTVRPDEKEIVVDTTVEDALDGVVEDDDTPMFAKKSSPPPSPKPAPAPAKAKAPSPPKPTTVREKEQHHHHQPKPKRRATTPPPQARPAENIFGAIDDNPQFARAMRSTLPKGPAPTEEEDWESAASYSTEEEAAPPPTRGKKRPPPPPKEEEEEDWGTEEDEPPKKHGKDPKPSYDSDGASSSVGASEVGGGGEEESIMGSEASSSFQEEDEEQTKEDEYIEKMKIIEQIKDYAKMGILPPQPPAFSMPISLLRKMRNYMESKADEIMGIGMIGTGWISIIGIIEKLNGQYDPFAKMFGMGLKLTGAKQAVAEKIHLYEAVFKHIYAKMPKSKEMNPWIQFGLVTMQILAEVHIKNMREEMEREAEDIARDPRTREDAEHVRKMFEERERQRKEERETPTRQVPPQPKMQPPSDSISEEEEEEVAPAAAKKDEKIDLQQPTPKEETPLKTKEEDSDKEEEEEEEETESVADSDDDVVVQLPAPKRRGTKKEDTI